jgi:hypothetical protein
MTMPLLKGSTVFEPPIRPGDIRDMGHRFLDEVGERPLVVDGVLVSSDNYLMLGVMHDAKAINVIPSGDATYKPADERKSDPLTDAMRSVLEQEVGLDMEEDMEFADMIGVFPDNEYTPGKNYVWEMQSKRKAKEIVDMQKKAKDGWKYDKVIGIKNKPEVVSRFMGATKFPVFPPAKGALPVYLNYLAGETELWKMCDVAVANQVEAVQNFAYLVNDMKFRESRNIEGGTGGENVLSTKVR